MAPGIRFNQNAGQPTLQPRVPLKAIGCWTAFDRRTSIPRGPGFSSPHSPKKIAESKSDSKRFARDVDRIQATLPFLNQPRSDTLIRDPLISSQPICGESTCRGARRDHSGVNAISRESRSFGPSSLLGLSQGQGGSGGWQVEAGDDWVTLSGARCLGRGSACGELGRPHRLYFIQWIRQDDARAHCRFEVNDYDSDRGLGWNKDATMKCQRCDKQAAFHITDLTGDSVSSVHLCPQCAKTYLEPQDVKTVESTSLVNLLSKQLKVGQTAEQLAALDQKVCPVCGISFFEFRKQGRLGCPHDYTFFAEELAPLIVNIHGATQHKGKHPSHSSLTAETQTQLIQLRRQMNEAVEQEDYELASQIRDTIRQLEGGEKE